MMPEPSHNYFLLFACCFPVKGHQRSLICDTQRNEFIFIPNALYELLTDCRGLSLQETYAHYQGAYNQEIDEYFSFLIEKEYGFFTPEPALFPEVDLRFREYAAINNAILDLGDEPAYDVQKVIGVLDELFCEAIQVRLLGQTPHRQLASVAAMLEGSGFSTVELIILHGQPFTAADMRALIKTNPRVTRITLFNCLEEQEMEEMGRPVIFSTAAVDAINDCGCVAPHYFSTHIRHLSEARAFNTCLNKKLAIGVDGKIRNCPSMKKDFGFFEADKLLDVIKMKAFQELWEVNKDKVAVCRDCEFRYVCTDCRAFIKDPENIFSKPEKCNYDPYTATWV